MGIDIRRRDETDRILTWYMITATRVLYAKYWKTTKIPRISEWLEKLIFCAEMDKITKKMRDQMDVKFQQDWMKRKDYINKKWKTKNLSLNFERY